MSLFVATCVFGAAYAKHQVPFSNLLQMDTNHPTQSSSDYLHLQSEVQCEFNTLKGTREKSEGRQ